LRPIGTRAQKPIVPGGYSNYSRCHKGAKSSCQCNTLQYNRRIRDTVTRYNTLQAVATYGSVTNRCVSATHKKRIVTLRRTATHCKQLLHMAASQGHKAVVKELLRRGADAQVTCVCCRVLQCVAVCCSVLQCVAVWCSVVQRGAVWCSVAATPQCRRAGV